MAKEWQQISLTGKQYGFTLLELMVVITLIGLIGSIIIARPYVTANDNNPAAELEILLKEMANKALIEQRWYGMQTDTDKYRLMQFSNNGWTPAGKKNWVELPANMTLEVSPQPANSESRKVVIFASPDGLLSNVSLILVTPAKDIILRGPYALAE
ncbi:prepilin-type N-terminal cleavage/methylation domain-containing protein [Aliamphritea ceti]|uniref:prepilin-type N-terminal cleavage/methylation domain-containing protein n=1 Tax=Aliamphritea ceti TaxID=1524258 RepID=UPI0021C38463|nr:prepilin-type N-terminal cleavage/methylation domain-containing protein [Aliamphritea ceti]